MNQARLHKIRTSLQATHIMKKILFFTFFIILLSANQTYADCKNDCILKNRSSDQQCDLEKTPLTRCEKFSSYTENDKKLNSSYKNLIKVIDKEGMEKLKKSQNEWIRWRDEKCEDVDDAARCDNGACAGVAHDSCVIDLTKIRTRELNAFKENIQHIKLQDFSFSKKYDPSARY